MNVATDLTDTLFGRYVQTLRIGPATHRHYHSVLRRFRRFMAARATPEELSEAALVDWLEAMSTELPLCKLYDHARKLDGFLSWLVDRGRLSANPWAELRAQYGRRLAPIIRALLAPDSGEALDALRPLPPFGSHLGPAMQQYLAYKQALGFRYARETTRLRSFDRYLQQRPDAEQLPLHRLVQEYAALGPTPESKFERLQSGRNLARGLQRHDPSIIVPALDRLTVRAVVQQRRRPYIFSTEEIRQLFAVALTLPSPKAPLRPLTLYTALALAYGAGLRLGELVRLTVGDVDLVAGTVDIHESKFFKSRRLPLTTSVLEVLHRYLAARREAGALEQPTSAWLWNEQKGHGYKEVTLEMLLTRLIRQAGLKPATGRVGPRLHDVRHTFVCHRMLAWYRSGVDVESRLPYLATYLGHKDVNSTLVYLTVTRELLQQAGDRFHAFGAQVLQTVEGGWMSPMTPFPRLLHAFFHNWLIEQRNTSRHTVIAYRDTWRLFLRFVAQRRQKMVAKLVLAQLTAAEVLAFLNYLEQERNVSIATRNCRLAALRSFFTFVADREPLAAAQCAEVLRIPTKRAPQKVPGYLETEEVAAILAQPDRTTHEGQRDHALLALLYNTGARIQEALDLCPRAVRLEPPASVRLYGKGKKERLCPLWPETAELIAALLQRKPRRDDEPIFVNCYDRPLGAAGVRYKLRHYVQAAAKQVPVLAGKRVTPHTFRHSTAVALVAAGVDVTVIRSWLGHVHLDTTNRYARANLETKRQALEQITDGRPAEPARWKDNDGLLDWLDAL